jgi:hypothetical protein
MHVSPSATGELLLKTKHATITLGATVRIGERELPGAGEYDVASVHVECFALTKAYAYLLRAEDLVITYLTDIDPTAINAEGVGDTAFLVIEVRSDSNPAEVKTLISKLEPAIVALRGAGATDVFAAQLGFSASRDFPIKLLRSALPETTTLYLV